MSIISLCQHGGAKSVIAAALFNAAGLETPALALAGEDPYDAVPPPVIEMLAREGIDVSAFTPRQLTAADSAAASRIITIGCPLEGRHVESWDDVPMVSEEPEQALATIRRHVDALLAELRG